jgi:hypothetical protein
MATISTSEYTDVEIHVGAKNSRALNNLSPHDPVIKVEKGGTLTLINDSRDCSEFEIVFPDCAPPSASDKLTGSAEEPIVLHMPLHDKTFAFYVIHKNKDGECVGRELMLARSCGPC